jgi:hypothetical protein
MAKRKKTKFVLNVKQLASALDKAGKRADKSIEVGRKSVAAARRAGDPKVLKANQANLNGAINASKKIKAAVRLMQGACCDQFFNCDPEFL